MVRINKSSNRAVDRNLSRAIEPLASYICAADRPRAALKSALAALFSEVEATNRAALAQCGTFLESTWS